MNSDESQETSPDVLAAEYVLGTLDGEERQQAEALIASDPDFAARVGQWERQLGELSALAGGVEPPPAVWDAIKAKLPETLQTMPLRLPELPRPSANVVDLLARVARFRMVAAANGAMAAGGWGLADQRIADVSLFVIARGLPALTAGPAVWI